ncbi:hypothetical protein BJY16_007116 [Actinoplanes octamycinicus]|uniref:Uncharacterized protein n=1 Tax=Actinoplanes octamycinicus TaxID=135948 RepID=A0A7W7MB54_9ACTN|nr:hypothetical protein [Actinoplanes octamycinicus]MBB4743657.1 hypothetical protein [Actinoplanes octamycinicus]
MLALAWLAVVRAAEQQKRGTCGDREQLIPISVPEARRLIAALLHDHQPDNDHTIAWSRFRRRQWQAQQCHWRRRSK